MFSVVIDAEGGSAAEQGVVHEDVGGVVVGVGVPEAAGSHPDAFAALLAEHNLNNDLEERSFASILEFRLVVAQGTGLERLPSKVTALPCAG